MCIRDRVPTYFGFDPRVQFVHERDAIDAFVAAVKNPVRGAVNVAAPGTIGLTKMLRRAGKISMPVPAQLFPTVTQSARRLGLFDFSPDFRRLLRYGRAVDTSRLIEEVGYTPQFDAVEAVEDYVATVAGRRVVPSVREAVAR